MLTPPTFSNLSTQCRQHDSHHHGGRFDSQFRMKRWTMDVPGLLWLSSVWTAVSQNSMSLPIFNFLLNESLGCINRCYETAYFPFECGWKWTWNSAKALIPFHLHNLLSKFTKSSGNEFHDYLNAHVYFWSGHFILLRCDRKAEN